MKRRNLGWFSCPLPPMPFKNVLYIYTFPLFISFAPALRNQVLSTRKKEPHNLLSDKSNFIFFEICDMDHPPTHWASINSTQSWSSSKLTSYLLGTSTWWLQALSRAPTGSSLHKPWPGRPPSFCGLTMNHSTDHSPTQPSLSSYPGCSLLFPTRS